MRFGSGMPIRRRLARMSGRRALGVLVLTGGLVALAATGCGRGTMTDERNIYYVRGMKLRDRKRYEDAARAFHTCLRLSPKSAKAHLQLALLYESALDDPLRCVYHYRMFLDMRPDDPHAKVINTWLARAERDLADALATSCSRVAGGQSQTAAPERRAGTEALEVKKTATPERGKTAEQKTVGERLRTLTVANDALKKTVTQLAARLRRLKTTATSNSTGNAPPPVETPAGATTAPAVATSAKQTRGSTEKDKDQTHRVASGESLSGLSRRYYGNLKYWPLLRDYNRDVLHGRDALRVGTILRLPSLEKLTTTAPGQEE